MRETGTAATKGVNLGQGLLHRQNPTFLGQQGGNIMVGYYMPNQQRHGSNKHLYKVKFGNGH